MAHVGLPRDLGAGAGGVSLPRLLSEQQVEQFYGLRVRTLQRWRLEGRGPRYRKLHGLVRYDVRDLDAWIAAAPAGGGGRNEA